MSKESLEAARNESRRSVLILHNYLTKVANARIMNHWHVVETRLAELENRLAQEDSSG